MKNIKRFKEWIKYKKALKDMERLIQRQSESFFEKHFFGIVFTVAFILIHAPLFIE